MTARIWLVAAGAASGFVGALQGQDLARRIDGAPEGPVGISFAARADVCGLGFSYLRVGEGRFGDGYSYTWSDGSSGAACETGPVRVLLSRSERRVTGVRVGAGTVKWPVGTADLGLAPAGMAAQYLLALAGGTDGRVGREALTAAVMADSAEMGRALVAMATNRALSRGLRESAASWLGRECAGATGRPARDLADALGQIATDPDEPTSVRSRAVTALGRGDGSEATLIGLTRSDEPAVAKAAVAALGRSGTRPAREALVRTARDTGGARSVRSEAVRALGGREATPADLAALRALWPGLTGEELKGAVLQTTAETGGSENARWLLAVARDGRRRPVSGPGQSKPPSKPGPGQPT